MITDLKDLDKLFKICRKNGISEMDYQGIKFTLGELPQQRSVSQEQVEPESIYETVPDRVLTKEELIFYSSGGIEGEAPPEVKNQ